MGQQLKRMSSVLVIGLILLVLAACGVTKTQESPGKVLDEKSEEKVLHVINGDIIPSMDPSMATDEFGFQFIGATMEGLYRLDENGEAVEGIAKEHQVSEDALIWTFELRKDAKWSNGSPVTANDFVYAWRRAVKPGTGSEYGPYMMNGVIKNAEAVSKGEAPANSLGVRAKDDYTLVVELEQPVPYFESLTTFGTFMPLNQKFVEAQGEDFATSSDTLLFNGPFTLENWKSTSQDWDLVKNKNYWDADTVQIERLHHVVVKDAQTQVDLYEADQVDRAGLSSDFVDKYAVHDDYTITPGTSVFYLKMNQTRNKALANINIRKAISMAFNKEDYVNEILNNGSLVANGLVPADFVSIPSTGGDFRAASGDRVIYDVDKAQDYWEKGLQELGVDSIELEFLGDDSENAKIGNEYIANQLSTNLPGLTVKIKNVPFKQRLDLDSAMDYDLQVSGWGPDYLDPNTFLSLFVTDGDQNKMGYSNPEYDKLIEQAGTTFANDNEKRYKNFLKAEKILFEDAAIAPIYQKSSAQLVSPKMEDVIVNKFGATYEYKWARVISGE